MKPLRKPMLIYDGDCGICKRLVSKWRGKTGDRIKYVPYQEISETQLGISLEELEKEVKFIHSDGRIIGGAAAAFTVIEHTKSPLKVLAWFYRHIPLFDLLSEWIYRIVSRNRKVFSRILS